MSPKRLRCSVVVCNNKHSSPHLLLTSDPLKTQWITFVFEGNAPPPPSAFTFTFSHLADAFIQSDLQMRTMECNQNQVIS